MRKAVHCGMPVSISIEPTTSCNLRCPECPSGLRQFSRPQGKIDIPAFQNIIDQLKDDLIYLMLYFQGEPMMLPEFSKMVDYAHSNGIYTASSTNGHYLTDENSHSLIESGLDRIIISMDGTDQQTYEQYRIGGQFDIVKQGIANLVRCKNEHGVKHPFIILQFLVLKYNEHQIPAMKKLAKELGVDKLELKSVQVYDFEDDKDLIPDSPHYARYVKADNGRWILKRPIRNRCFRMWSGAVLTWDSLLVPCCFDKDAEHQMGKLDKNSFKELWKSKTYKEFRSQILEDRSQINICKNCTE